MTDAENEVICRTAGGNCFDGLNWLSKLRTYMECIKMNTAQCQWVEITQVLVGLPPLAIAHATKFMLHPTN